MWFSCYSFPLFYSLKQFYVNSSNLQYFKQLIKIPLLPEVSVCSSWIIHERLSIWNNLFKQHTVMWQTTAIVESLFVTLFQRSGFLFGTYIRKHRLKTTHTHTASAKLFASVWAANICHTSCHFTATTSGLSGWIGSDWHSRRFISLWKCCKTRSIILCVKYF